MNNLVTRCVHIKDVKTVDKKTKKVIDIDWDYWKFIIFSSIYGSILKNKANEVVIAVDNRKSWRYDFWPRYKEDRKLKREKQTDDFPWDEFFKRYEIMLDEFQEHLPIKVLRVEKSEGDDIIGVIVNNVPEHCVVISTDKDFLQLDSDRVTIYDPLKQQKVSHPNPEMFLVEQSLLGQSKDSIFNIKNPLDYPLGKRKKPFGPKALEKVLIYGWEKWLKDNDLVERFEFNKTLMDFKRIPKEIQSAIMKEYLNYKYPHPDNIWKFIKENNWPDYKEKFTSLENTFLNLY
jgi:hypothetical protein